MQSEVEFITRLGGTPSGKEWDKFMAQQRELLAQRANDGWTLVSALGVNSPSGMREASQTSGVLLYFHRAS